MSRIGLEPSGVSIEFNKGLQNEPRRSGALSGAEEAISGDFDCDSQQVIGVVQGGSAGHCRHGQCLTGPEVEHGAYCGNRNGAGQSRNRLQVISGIHGRFASLVFSGLGMVVFGDVYYLIVLDGQRQRRTATRSHFGRVSRKTNTCRSGVPC